MLLTQNSNEKAAGAGLTHVIPSAMMDTISENNDDIKSECNPLLAVVREFGEELLGVNELIRPVCYNGLIYLLSECNPNLTDLYKSIVLNETRNDKIRIYATGLVLDIFTLRPELTYLLVIDNDEITKHFKLSWESAGKLHFIDIEDDKKVDRILSGEYQGIEPCVAPARAAIKKGRDKWLEISRSEHVNN
jgi:hypothetical protein